MTPERRAEARRQDAMIQGVMPPLRRAIAQEKNIYVRQCAEAWRNHRQLRNDDYFAHQSRVEGILYSAYVRIGMIMNKEIISQIKAKRPSLEVKKESKFEYYLKKWARDEAGRKAKAIAGTTQSDINRAVRKSYAEDGAETAVISDILSVRGFSNFRADTIARTETHNAAMFASLETVSDYADEEGVTMLKVWSPTIDDRSREYHAAMESYDAIGMNELFQVENPKGGTDAMDRPGDPSAPPEQVINCRCVLTYEVQ